MILEGFVAKRLVSCHSSWKLSSRFIGVMGAHGALYWSAVCFIPVIYFLYPETKKHSLEEIDLIFAKGFVENISYIRAAEELPLLDERGIKEMSRRYEPVDKDIEQTGTKKEENSENETRASSV